METRKASHQRNDENVEMNVEDSSAEEQTAYVLCRTSSLDCRIDQAVCVEGKTIGEYESEQEAHEALIERWERGTCF